MYSYCTGGAIPVVKHNGSRQLANLMEEPTLLQLHQTFALDKGFPEAAVNYPEPRNRLEST